MKPEVLVWALLFVIVFGVGYRFFARVLSRSKRSEDVHRIEPDTSEAATASVAIPSAENVLAEITPSAPVAEIADHVMPAPLAPDVRATLPPTGLDTPPVSKALPSVLGTTSDGVLPSGERQTTIRWRGTRLRARKIGQKTPPLDQRIRGTLTRRLRPATKPRRKPVTLREQTEMPISHAILGRTPTRRIGRKLVARNHLLSSKAATKILGAPARSPRVRLASVQIE